MKSIFVILMAAAAAGNAVTSNEAARLTSEAERLYLQLRYAEAEPIFRQAVDAWTAIGPEAQRNRALAMSDLGSLLRALGRYPEAEQMLNDSLRDLEPGVDASRALWNLATLYRTRGELGKAESSALRAAEMVDGPDRVAPRLVLASIYTEQRRYAEAEEILAWAEEGADDALRVAIDNNIAAIGLTTGKYSRAEQYSRKAIELGRSVLPDHHPAVAAALNSLGQARRFQGDSEEAEPAYRESMELWEKAAGPSHPNVARVMMNLGALYHERGREAGAESLYRKAAATLEVAYGPENNVTLSARIELADVLRAERRFTEADKLSAATVTSLERALPPGDARLLDALKIRWRILSESGRTREASAVANRVRLSVASGGAPDTGAARAADGISGALLSK